MDDGLGRVSERRAGSHGAVAQEPRQVPGRRQRAAADQGRKDGPGRRSAADKGHRAQQPRRRIRDQAGGRQLRDDLPRAGRHHHRLGRARDRRGLLSRARRVARHCLDHQADAVARRGRPLGRGAASWREDRDRLDGGCAPDLQGGADRQEGRRRGCRARCRGQDRTRPSRRCHHPQVRSHDRRSRRHRLCGLDRARGVCNDLDQHRAARPGAGNGSRRGLRGSVDQRAVGRLGFRRAVVLRHRNQPSRAGFGPRWPRKPSIRRRGPMRASTSCRRRPPASATSSSSSTPSRARPICWR